jgi:hypothetical protein
MPKKSPEVNSLRTAIIQDIKIIIARKMLIILGTKVNVCSWIEVVVCKMETIRPTIIAVPKMGAEIIMVTYMASRIK